jgi:hypothetical protein
VDPGLHANGSDFRKAGRWRPVARDPVLGRSIGRKGQSRVNAVHHSKIGRQMAEKDHERRIGPLRNSSALHRKSCISMDIVGRRFVPEAMPHI